MSPARRFQRVLDWLRFKKVSEQLKEDKPELNRRARRIIAAANLRRDKRSHRQKTHEANMVAFQKHHGMPYLAKGWVRGVT